MGCHRLRQVGAAKVAIDTSDHIPTTGDTRTGHILSTIPSGDNTRFRGERLNGSHGRGKTDHRKTVAPRKPGSRRRPRPERIRRLHQRVDRAGLEFLLLSLQALASSDRGQLSVECPIRPGSGPLQVGRIRRQVSARGDGTYHQRCVSQLPRQRWKRHMALPSSHPHCRRTSTAEISPHRAPPQAARVLAPRRLASTALGALSASQETTHGRSD